MATLLQVLQTLTSLATTACYPNGTSMPSVTGKEIILNSGFVIRSQQDFDINAGYSNVYVYPTPRARQVTKFERDFQPITLSAATLILTINTVALTVTITGTVSVPQAVMIIVNGIGYGYLVQVSDTLNTIATNTAALIPGATATGNVINLSGDIYSLTGSIATNYTAAEELGRVERVFNIFVASPNYVDRSTILDAIDVYLRQQYRVTLPDNFVGMVFPVEDEIWDDSLEQYQDLKGRLNYMIQYPTTLTQNFTTITDPFINSLSVSYS
jgi:hypothetical protein